MSHLPHQPKQDAASRAQNLVFYLDRRCTLPDGIPQNIKPKSLQSDIGGILEEAERAAREMGVRND